MRRALVVLMFGALLPLARVLVDPFGSLPGDELGDVYKHAWSFWHATVSPGLWTEHLNAPDGGLLFDVMWLPSRLLVPLTLVTGAVFASNLWVWLSLVLVGLCTWAAARDLSDSPWPPICAGLLVQTAPYLMGYPLFSGVYERLAVWVFPLLLVGLSRVAERGDWRWALACLLGLTAATSGCQVYGVFAVLQIGLMLPWLGTRAVRTGHLGWLVGTLAALALSLMGLAALTIWAAEHAMSLAPQEHRDGLGLGPQLPEVELGRLQLMLDPMAARTQPLTLSGDRLAKTQYLGWVPLVLGVVGAAWDRKPRMIVGVGVGVAAALVALGPLGGWNLAYLGAVWTVPALGSQPNPWQLVALFSPLCALGVVGLLNRLPRRWALPGSAAALGLILLERGLVNPIPLVLPTAPGRVSEVYDQLPEGNLVELPRAWRGGDGAHGGVFLAQTVHERPLGVAVNIGSTGLDMFAPVVDARSGAWSGAAYCFRMGGFTSLAVHRSWLSEPGVPELMAADPSLTVLADDGEILLLGLGDARPTGRSRRLMPGGSAEMVRRRADVCPFE
jgi:hypothetical protein